MNTVQLPEMACDPGEAAVWSSPVIGQTVTEGGVKKANTDRYHLV